MKSETIQTEPGRRTAQSRLDAESGSAACRATIWIDMDNTPHVPFFEPIMERLRSRGFAVMVTARDAFQVCQLADKKGISYIKVGRHHGKNRLAKATGLIWRALQLVPHVRSRKPVIGVSHGARSQLIAGNLLGVPTVLIEDYEYCQFPRGMRPTWVMAPEVIPESALPNTGGNVFRYPGIKEDVYASNLTPDPSLLTDLGVSPTEILATVRPPATEAHYHNPEAEILFEAFMNRVTRTPNTRVVLLPRNHRQSDEIRAKWPGWFENDRTIVPRSAVDGLNLIWFSDLVVSGGGTMNREAAALGVPVYSIFRGTIGAVDRHLTATGRLVLVESTEDTEKKIAISKRTRLENAAAGASPALDTIVATIERLADQTLAGRR